MDDPYYMIDTALFDGRFRYFGSEPVQVRGKVHLSKEHYRFQQAERETEPITTLRGMRSYVHMKPFVLVPHITLTIGLYQQPTAQGTIGEVLSSQEAPKMKEVEIGQAQAWYYLADTTIVLWECYLFEFVQRPLLEDTNMAELWGNFAHFLGKHFTGATRITTPSHDPLFSNEEYHEFLAALGYHPIAKAAWGKSIAEKE